MDTDCASPVCAAGREARACSQETGRVFVSIVHALGRSCIRGPPVQPGQMLDKSAIVRCAGNIQNGWFRRNSPKNFKCQLNQLTTLGISLRTETAYDDRARSDIIRLRSRDNACDCATNPSQDQSRQRAIAQAFRLGRGGEAGAFRGSPLCSN